MTLREIIEYLERFLQVHGDRVVPLGWGAGSAHAYRGIAAAPSIRFADLGFEPRRNVTVAEMLDEARAALGRSYPGWKGGGFLMHEFVECHIAENGRCSADKIGPLLLAFLVGDDV